jgi:hypothetical protein
MLVHQRVWHFFSIKTLMFRKFSSPNCRRYFGVLVADPPLFFASVLGFNSSLDAHWQMPACALSIASKKRAAAWTVTQPVAEDDPLEAGIFNGCT